MLRTYKLLFLFSLSFFTQIPGILCEYRSSRNAYNNCTINKFKIPLQFNVMKTIYQFSCFTNTPLNPKFPSLPNSYPNEYNELDLSPNFYSEIPTEQICPYKYLQVLNLGSNLIRNISGTFYKLKCLTSLSQIDLSNNLIESTLEASDFDDFFAAQLQSLNFSSNRIHTIKTNAFLDEKGKSRFTNLRYVNFANNLIKEFDLLWPLLLPSQSILIDVKQNPIISITNQLGLNYDDPLLGNNLVGYRYLDVTDNQIDRLDDSNLLQYGLHNHTDFQSFLQKIANYDLRTIRTPKRLFCDCEQKQQKTVDWFRQFDKTVDSIKYPIYQLFCANMATKQYIFNFSCPSTTTTTITTTTTTTTITTTTTSSTTTATKISTRSTTKKRITSTTTSTKVFKSITTRSNQPVELITPDFYMPMNNFDSYNVSNNLPTRSNFSSFINEGLRLDTNSTMRKTENENLYLLILLIIPAIIIAVTIFVCGIGRSCQVFFYKTCQCILCPCFRQDDSSALNGKVFDMTICYSDNDEHWLNEQFMTQLSEFDRGYKIHKLNLNNQSNIGKSLSEEQKRILCKSKRIVLMFSEKFTKDEWSDKQFRDFIKKIYLTDRSCILVPVNLGSMTSERIKVMFTELTSRNIKTNDINQLYTYKSRNSMLKKFSSRMSYTCGLSKIEILNWVDEDFWENFNYIMPIHPYAEITNISHSTSGRKLKANSIDIESNESSPRVPAIMYSHEPKPRRTRPNNRRRIEVPHLPMSFSDNTSDASEAPRTTSVRQVIVPIPEEMRIKLGQFALKSNQIGSVLPSTPNSQTVTAVGEDLTPRSEYSNKKKVMSSNDSYDIVIASSRQNQKPNNLPSIENTRREMSEILKNFKPELSNRQTEQKKNNLDRSFNDTTLENDVPNEQKNNDKY